MPRVGKTFTDEERRAGGLKGAAVGKAKTEVIKSEFLESLLGTRSRKRALMAVDRSEGSITRWRQDLEFRRKMDEINEIIRSSTSEQRQMVADDYTERTGTEVTVDDVEPVVLEFKPGSFEEFRQIELGNTTYKHQQIAVRQWENTPLGNIVMMLWPPDHGKTTLAEDYATWKLAVDDQFRIMVACETNIHSRKIIGRVKNRMEYDGPFPRMVKKYGPFSPHDPRLDTIPSARVWGADYWNLIGKRSGDQRDYSMEARGITGQIAGTRTDKLLGDDITSLKNYNQTAKLIELFVQDWISRPGEWGSTALNGTRVGIDDFYEALQELYPPSILTVIRQAAITWDPDQSKYVPLWPERYNMDQLHRMRIKVTEEPWARNWMQEPSAKALSTFPDDVVDPTKDPAISAVGHDIPEGHGFIAMLDPSIGGVNVWTIAEVTSQWFMPVWIERTIGLTSYDQIFGQLDRLLARYCAEGATCLAVIIEDRAFQKGLLEDHRLLALQRQYGFNVEGHTTGYSKHDKDIGIPMIPTMMRRGEFITPWADDETTQLMMGGMLAEMERWRPHKKGTELEQDIVMTIYFGTVWWSRLRATTPSGTRTSRAGRTRRLPYEPTQLVGTLPSGYRR